MDQPGGGCSEPGPSRMPGEEGNADQSSGDEEGEGEQKVAARQSNPASPDRGQELHRSLLREVHYSERLTEEEAVRARADDAASSLPSEPSLQLDSIWSRDVGPIDLPDYVKVHNTISFPEKLMLLLIHIERTLIKSGRNTNRAPIAWTFDGRAFVIRDREQLLQDWLPLFFPRGKYQSFTRKLYRWEFRQVLPRRDKPESKDKEAIFAHPYFQRDRKELMAYMRSVTAAGLRRQQQRAVTGAAVSALPTAATARAEPERTVDSFASQSDALQLPLVQQGTLHGVHPHSSIGQTQPLAIQHLINSLVFSNTQIHPLASLDYSTLDPRVQRQMMLASLLRSANAPVAPDQNLSQLAMGSPYSNANAQTALLQALASAQVSPPAAASAQPTLPPVGNSLQQGDFETDVEFQQRLRQRVADMLARGGNPSQRRDPPSDRDERKGRK